jgi:hypothetical protein
LLDLVIPLCLLIPSFSVVFCFLGFAEYTEVSSLTLQPDNDPLIAAVSLLEANWISVREIFELVNRIFTRIFIGLWPKQKAEVSDNDVKKFAQAFNTIDDPILHMKGLSLKRGAEGAIVLSYAHGEEIDWKKVSSSHGCPRSELKAFLEKAKKYAPGIVSLISPSVASATAITPLSSTPVTSGSMPPPKACDASATPTSAADREAKVA